MPLVAWFDAALAAAFPDACVGCGRSGSLVCDACLRDLPPAPASPLPYVHSAYAYADPRAQALVWLLKYRSAKRIAWRLAPAMAELLVEYLGEEGTFLPYGQVLLVPVPLARERRASRGYNQAELLARAIVRVGTVRARVDTTLLSKVRHTTPQARIAKRSVRLNNLAGAFRAVPNASQEACLVVLVDDVTTTGATLEAARAALLAAGYRHIVAITACH